MLRFSGKLIIASLLALAIPSASRGQTTFPTANGSSVPGAVMMCVDSATGLAAPVLVSGSTCPSGSGGGGGGAITMASGAAASGAYSAGSIASGASVDLGAQADTACTTDNGTCSEIALVKRNNQRLTTIIAGIPVTNAGTFAVTQATASNLNATIVGTGTFVTQSAVTAASGSFASGSFASGSHASGSFASGALASGSVASGAIASGAIAAGAQVDLLTMRGTKAPGTAAANSLLGGCVYTAAGVTLTDGQQVAGQCDASGNYKVSGIGIANNATPVTGSPIGGVGRTAEPAAITNGNFGYALQDVQTRLINFPYTIKENLLQGTILTAMTGTTSTAVTGMGAPGASVFNYITTIVCSNSHATVGTDVELQDGSGGTSFFLLPAAAVYGGAVIPLPAPLKQPTANTGLFAKNATTGASVRCAFAGFKGA